MVLNEEMLVKALLLDMEQRVEFPPSYYEPHTFSKKFERRMKAMAAQVDRPPFLRVTSKLGKRVAMLFLALLAAAFVTVMSVEGLRKEFFSFVEERFAQYSRISYVAEDGYSLPHGDFAARAPTYIPEGLECKDSDDPDTMGQLYLYYKDESTGKDLLYQQNWVDEASIGINTEGVTLQQVEVAGYDGYYCENIGFHMLFWDDGSYFYFISSNIDRSTVFKAAESLEPIDPS